MILTVIIGLIAGISYFIYSTKRNFTHNITIAMILIGMFIGIVIDITLNETAICATPVTTSYKLYPCENNIGYISCKNDQYLFCRDLKKHKNGTTLDAVNKNNATIEYTNDTPHVDITTYDYSNKFVKFLLYPDTPCDKYTIYVPTTR